MTFGRRQSEAIAQIYSELQASNDNMGLSPELLFKIAMSLERAMHRKAIVREITPEPKQRARGFHYNEPVDHYIRQSHGWVEIFDPYDGDI